MRHKIEIGEGRVKVTMSKKKKIPVIACTAEKGIFFGYMDEGDENAEPLTLILARMCIYFSEDMKGGMGLASDGPSESCRISGTVPKISLRNVTVVMTMTDVAVERWEKAPWKQ